MKIGITLIIIGFMLLISAQFLKYSVQTNPEKPRHNHHTIIIHEDNKNISLDGALLIIRKSSQDTIVVGNATVNDAINFLEENGHG